VSAIHPARFSDLHGRVKRFVDRLSRDRVDWKYRAETGGIIQMSALGVKAPNAQFAYCYRATLGWVIRLFLRQLPLEDGHFSFIDFGSGKGRALLVASEFPFVSITGIEFCESLHAIALRNIACLSEKQRCAGRVVSVFGDAAEFELPRQNLVTYFYNPFGPPVLDVMAERLAAHHRAGFQVFVIYINPRHRDVFERSGRFRPVFSHKKGLIYQVAS
jgi:hypothetical protein